jgi:hypothetical protein
VGAPTRDELGTALDEFRRRWPARFKARFGDRTVVASRILVTSGPASHLRAMRDRLGESLTSLKGASAPEAEGLLVRV